jgi:diguanylate cyclase (GGDEF)-like protein/PAS domain S-box-containing protein
MTNAAPSPEPLSHSAMPGLAVDAAGKIAELSDLLAELDGWSKTRSGSQRLELSDDDHDRLAQARLGVAGSLFLALKHKDPGTARRSLRVALGCSAWSLWMEQDPRFREQLELAALVHDVGKIGVPDRVLLKPGPLNSEEVELMSRHRSNSLEILQGSCAATEVLVIIRDAHLWYDGSNLDQGPAGDALPLGARMLSIVVAYEAMMADQVFRRPLTPERALLEIYRNAGRQFDPTLVRKFTEFHQADRRRFEEQVAEGWLKPMLGEWTQSPWQRMAGGDASSPSNVEALMHRRLVENMLGAVIAIDLRHRITEWNPGAERLTGIVASGVVEREWSPGLITMRDNEGRRIADSCCPLVFSLQSRTSWHRRLMLEGRTGDPKTVDAHGIPVLGADGAPQGAVLLMYDVTQQLTLEERCHDLHEMAMKDPLTGLANRAEFDRKLDSFVTEHGAKGNVCALVICDIDRFKHVNDTYGHPAGDAVIQSFAQLIASHVRQQDVAARYGGEEFVLLCEDCDNASAAERAEAIRAAFEALPQPALGGSNVTASFGVTALQAGDSAATLLRRADRALLMAKDSGRNQVVQLGTGVAPPEQNSLGRWLLGRYGTREQMIVQAMVSAVPLQVVLEKLRGFIADHRAEVVAVQGFKVVLRVGDDLATPVRRSTDRPVRFEMEVDLEEERDGLRGHDGMFMCTRVRVGIFPMAGRDRRRTDALDRARHLLVSLRAYLMATLEETQTTVAPAGMLQRACEWLNPWKSPER